MKGGRSVNEQEIVKLIRNRDEKGMEELLRHYGPLMRYIIAPILQNPEDREECLSDTAMRVWERIEQFDTERGSWNAWLTAIARNTAINRARRNARSDTALEIPPEMPSRDISPEESVLKNERNAALLRALLQLPSNEVTLFYRKYYYMQSTEQIASEMGLSLRAVEGKLYRIKKKLRKMLGGVADV